jgi:hypothetical protein
MVWRIYKKLPRGKGNSSENKNYSLNNSLDYYWDFSSFFLKSTIASFFGATNANNYDNCSDNCYNIYDKIANLPEKINFFNSTHYQ